MALPTDPATWPATLEAMRNIGLRLRADGVFEHQGVAVTHARLQHALLSWLARTEDGRDIVTLDPGNDGDAASTRRFAYVTVEDTHLRARSARWTEQDRCLITWDDLRETELAYESIVVSADHSWRVAVGPLTGRVRGAAYQQMLSHIESDDDATFWLRAAGQRWALPMASAAG